MHAEAYLHFDNWVVAILKKYASGVIRGIKGDYAGDPDSSTVYIWALYNQKLLSQKNLP